MVTHTRAERIAYTGGSQVSRWHNDNRDVALCGAVAGDRADEEAGDRILVLLHEDERVRLGLVHVLADGLANAGAAIRLGV